MTNSTGDVLDRTTSGRFVRNLALSLSGGALVTLLGASAAQAQDAGTTGSASDGTGAAQSGDATAVGNQSGTQSTQTVTVSGNLGTIQVINQQANVSNVGGAVANTGGNIAIGNTSDNDADADQDGTSGLGPASNSGEAANNSNGSAAISTGHASAIGNQSNTSINQVAHGSAHGQLGGILVINQNAAVTNSGVALANSGGNFATGNDSDNDAGLLQDANTLGGIAANSGSATNGSDGKATINTGAASATGNKSDTQIFQSATGSAGGALGGIVLIDQNAFVLNSGAAVANSGGNRAIGNSSDNDADTDQDINEAGNDALIGVASNNGEASNWSGGTANVTTGAASAVGNESTTKVTQESDTDITGAGGVSLTTQNSSVINAGLGIANSGLNFAQGNDSDNDADVDQFVPAADGTLIGVVGNFGKASNESDGHANVNAGPAWAAGNRSDTVVEQNIETNGGAFNLQTQANNVTNLGAGISSSGLNAAVGNTSDNDADVDQDAELGADTIQGVGVLGQFGLASNSSDGTAQVTTGAASAVGNDSTTGIGQTIDPAGLVINTQVAQVTNAGFAVANSGGNIAIGNDSDNNASLDQDSEIFTDNGTPQLFIAGTLVASNNGESSNTSDGVANISTGHAAATGNESQTNLRQEANGSVDGIGGVINTQVAGVQNLGVAAANSGGNFALGNDSDNDSDLDQDIDIASNNNNDVTLVAGILTASNQGTSSNTSDGTADIHTGTASATGNRSGTVVDQNAEGTVDGLGLVLNTQVGDVANVGVGVANSGGNIAIGNTSENESDLDQDVDILSQNDGDSSLIAGLVTASNSGTSENVSDGKGSVWTGAADATGNASATHFTQAASGDANGFGLPINTQVGGVLNAGVGIANSGLNIAVGNVSDNDGGQGADADQNVDIASNNGPGDTDIVAGAITGANQGEATNASDGTANVITGGAQGQGNVSSTYFGQGADSTVDGMGFVLSTQVGGVANVGVGVANSGLNAAVGNASENEADLDQDVEIASDNGPGPVDLVVLGPVTGSNSGEASNASDGSAKVHTGGALATGNASATTLSQQQSGNVSELGFVVGTQVGGVANVGLGVANSGLNLAVANASENDADADQDTDFDSNVANPVNPLVIGPLTAANDGTASNTSDGEACVCTGNAVASGNVSSTTLIQDLDLNTGSGAVVLTAVGGVTNAGLGVANSGLNAALGNISDNDADLEQDATIGNALLPIVGPQTAHSGGDATNSSAGSAKVASGNASGTGNQSTTDYVQAAAVDADFAVATLSGGTTNAGLGLANAGLNLGVGNDSTNASSLTQTADGSGIVNNDGSASNDSDGDATIGDPTKCDDVVPTTPSENPETPGVPSLPRTGGAIEAQAAFALMLLLLGFGLKRKGESL